jgi:hypothetical protein
VTVDIPAGAEQRKRGLIEEDCLVAILVVPGLVRVGRIVDVLLELDLTVPMT